MKKKIDEVKKFPTDKPFYVSALTLTNKMNEVIDTLNLLIERSNKDEKNS